MKVLCIWYLALDWIGLLVDVGRTSTWSPPRSYNQRERAATLPPISAEYRRTVPTGRGFRGSERQATTSTTAAGLVRRRP